MSTAQQTDGKPKGFRRIPADRYRAFELRIWRLLQGLDGDAVKLFLYLWSGPHSQPHGILYFPRQYVIVDLAWSAEQLARAWTTLEKADLLWSDGELVVVVPFLQANPPANRDVVGHWRKAIATLPDSPLFERLYRRASAWVSEEGLSWLVSRITTVAPTVSVTVAPTVPPTGPTLSTQYAGLRTQDTGLRVQEAGVRVQGGTGGEGQGEEPAASARCASPLGTASLAEEFTEADLFGQNPEALEETNPDDGRHRRLMVTLRWLPGSREEKTRTQLSCGYSREEIHRAFAGLDAEDSRAGLASGNGKCRGVSRAGECCSPALSGSRFCRFHQGQASAESKHELPS